MYKSLIRPLLFLLDSETAHDILVKSVSIAPNGLLKPILGCRAESQAPTLKRELMGLSFKNPIGLAAGFDKNCEAPELFSLLGFGHLEIGTVTPKPQPGNPKPRIFRSPKDRALVNRMGFPSKGADVVKQNLKRFLDKNSVRPVIGVNIGKQKDTPLDRAHEDYSCLAKVFSDLADYFTVNISSPNTPGLRDLQEPERLKSILAAVRGETSKPVVVKISPDLSDDALKEIVELLVVEKVSGIAATNTTIDKIPLAINDRPEGGLSGSPLFSKAKNVVQRIKVHSNGKLPIIGIGGIASASDAKAFFDAGASLIQIYTGLIYEGPRVVCKILRGLDRTQIE